MYNGRKGRKRCSKREQEESKKKRGNIMGKYYNVSGGRLGELWRRVMERMKEGERKKEE